MEITINSTHLMVWDDYGKNFAIWALAELDASRLWVIVDAVRRGSRETVEAIAKGAHE